MCYSFHVVSYATLSQIQHLLSTRCRFFLSLSWLKMEGVCLAVLHSFLVIPSSSVYQKSAFSSIVPPYSISNSSSCILWTLQFVYEALNFVASPTREETVSLPSSPYLLPPVKASPVAPIPKYLFVFRFAWPYSLIRYVLATVHHRKWVCGWYLLNLCTFLLILCFR